MAKRTYGKYSGKNPTEKLTDARQALFDALLADMEREGSRWVKEWSVPHPPMNGVTGKGYGPRNTAMLMYAMRDGGFRDPRFATFKMASDKGCHIIKASPCPVIETPNDEAFYLPGADKIYVPQRNQFTNVESFCRTLLHEMGHSTGHPSRLDREQCGLKQNRQKYAFEELIAELSSVFTANAIGLDLRGVDDDKPLSGDEVDAMSNSAAYLKGWASQLKDPGGELLKAATRASKATDYLVKDCFTPSLGKEYFKSMELANETVVETDMEQGGEFEIEQDGGEFSLDDLCASKCDEADIANGDDCAVMTSHCEEER